MTDAELLAALLIYSEDRNHPETLSPAYRAEIEELFQTAKIAVLARMRFPERKMG